MRKIVVLMLVLSLVIPGQAFAKGTKGSQYKSSKKFDSTYSPPVPKKRRK